MKMFFKVLKNLDINPKTYLKISIIFYKRFRQKTNEAYEKGVFGAPSFVSNNKIFWGQDRIEFVIKGQVNSLFFFFSNSFKTSFF